MKNILKFYVCCVLILSFNVFAQEIGVSWDFNTAGDTEGWQNGQGFSEITSNDSNLYAQTSESFAKLSSSEFSVNSNDFGYVKIQMKTKNITRGMVSWYTDTNKYGYTYFTVSSDSQYNVYEIPVYEKSKWLDNITSLQVSFWTNGQACAEIDYIQIMSKGLWLDVTTFKPLRTVFKKDHEIPLTAYIKNTGDKDIGSVSLKLEVPDEIQLSSGDILQEYTYLEIGSFDTLTWKITSSICDEYQVKLKIYYATGDSAEQSFYFDITDQYWKYDDIWLGAWNAPQTLEPLNDFYLNMGFKDILYINPDEDDKLNMFHQLGIRCMINIGHLVGLHFEYPSNDEPVDDFTEDDLAELDVVLDKYKDHPAVFGYFLCDEPSREGYGFHNIGLVNDYVREKAPQKFGFVNALVALTDRVTQPLGIERYLEIYMDKSRPQLLSYDHYPFRYEDFNGAPFDPFYYGNLELYRKYSLLYDVPLFNHIQAFNYPSSGWCMPTPSQIRLQVWVSLAYGVKGFNYFIMYWGGNGFMDDEYKQVNDPIVREVNNDICTLGPHILPLTSISVFHVLNTPPGCTDKPANSLVKSASNDADLVVGMFQDEKHADYMILANKDYQDSVSTTITLNKTIDDLYYYNIDAGEWTSIPLNNSVSGSSFNFSFLAGGGALFKIGDENTFVDENSKTLSTTFRLDQNYPNPFNPVTKINYSLSHAGQVNLTVYDLLGRQVAVLVDKNQKAGEYRIEWNALNFPSGVYIYRLETGSIVQTRKMVLVK